VVALKAFNKGEMDFIRLINPPTKISSARYIIIAINYLTRWAEAKSVKDCNSATTTHFMCEKFITRFGCPMIHVSDQGTHFLNKTIAAMIE